MQVGQDPEAHLPLDNPRRGAGLKNEQSCNGGALAGERERGADRGIAAWGIIFFVTVCLRRMATWSPDLGVLCMPYERVGQGGQALMFGRAFPKTAP